MANTAMGQLVRLALVIGLTGLSACAELMRNPEDFNQPLIEPANPASDSCPRVTSGEITCIRSGMRLVVIETDGRLNPLQDRTLIESRTEWRIPEPGEFSQEDLFHLAWLLSVSHGDKVADPSACYEAWLRQPNAPQEFLTGFVPQILSSLTLTLHIPNSPPQPKVKDIQSWMRSVPAVKTAAGAYYNRQIITFTIPASPGACKTDKLTAFDSGSPFEREPVQPAAGPNEPVTSFDGPHGWYKVGTDSVLVGRAFVSVEIPVTAAGTAGTFYVPIDSSLTEVAERLGHPGAIIGLRRDRRLIPAGKVPEAQQADLGGDTVLIGSNSGTDYYQPHGAVLVDRAIFGDMLAAPGDQLIFRE